jgi:uroporphyrinogen III methyltransferase / synthase
MTGSRGTDRSAKEGAPLRGLRIVVTRPRSQSGPFVRELEALGAEVLLLPTIRVGEAADPEPLRRAAARAGSFDWIVFTSANAVARFWAALREAGLDSRSLEGVSLCAIGPASAAAVAREGGRVALVPEEHVAEAVVEALAAAGDLRGRRILFPRAAAARAVVPAELRRLGAEVTEVEAYRTMPDRRGGAELAERLRSGEVDVITFTSSSAVRNFVAAAGAGVGDATVASIGPVTSATVRELGLPLHVEARSYTVAGLVRAICEHVAREGAGP